jgi:SAM-dependent methyltransferase
MVRTAASTVPAAAFVQASAEVLPIATASVDLISAAGSLNYVNLDRFFPEADRALKPGGALLVYDFSQGRTFRGSNALEQWFAAFEQRYPRPQTGEREITPATLGNLRYSLRLAGYEEFETSLRLSPEFYVDYVMTETNIASAMHSGSESSEIRDWCARSLEPVFAGSPREVIFKGYLAWMKAREV